MSKKMLSFNFLIFCVSVEDNFRQYGVEIELCIKDENGQILLKFEALMTSNGKQTQFIPDSPPELLLFTSGQEILI